MVMQMNGVRINAGQTLQGNYQNVEGTPGKYEIVIISAINTVQQDRLLQPSPSECIQRGGQGSADKGKVIQECGGQH
ncbi:MAG: hypothetical protein MZV63_18465 [Marinilabiliales bacterium]|nr:hypothetical protein [Marinilabiliales bacterium]